MSMEARLERMERRCRGLTAGVIALAAILATACLSSAMRGAPEVVRAKQIEVLRDDGKPGIVLVGDVHVQDESVSGSAIWMTAADTSARSGWTLGRIRHHENEPWQACGEFYLETDPGADGSGSSVGFKTSGAGAAVNVEGGHQRAALEADANRTSLRFLDVDPKAVEEEDDTVRLSLDLVDGVPALKATGADGKTSFEQP
jgi:hypothetical protein